MIANSTGRPSGSLIQLDLRNAPPALSEYLQRFGEGKKATLEVTFQINELGPDSLSGTVEEANPVGAEPAGEDETAEHPGEMGESEPMGMDPGAAALVLKVGRK